MMQRIHLRATLSPLGLLCTTCAFGQADGSVTEPLPLESVVVTGTETGMEAVRAEIASVPGGATLIDMEDYRGRNIGSLADVLRYVPGVWSVSDAGSDGIFFSSRGSNLDATDWDMNGIKLLQDGLPVTTADGNNHNRIIDPLAARYATMARGANALTYGASTLGGAVNFVTPTGRESPGAAVSMSAGSHGQKLARLSFGEAFGDSLDGLVTIEGRRWEGYRDHSEQERAGLYANLGWRLAENVTTRFYATALENDQELAGSLNREEHGSSPGRASRAAVDGNYRLDVDTRRLANRTSLEFSEDRQLELGLSIEEQALFHPVVWVASDPDGAGPAPESELFSLLIDTNQRDIATMLRYSRRVRDHELLFGLNYGHNDVDGGHYRNLGGRPNGLTTLVENTAATAELFAMDRWRVTEETTLILAAQAVSAAREVRSTMVSSGAVSDPKARYEQINPRFGFLRSIGADARLYGNVSRMFEPPTNYELEDNVAGGSAVLEPMTGTVAEIGTRGDHSFGEASRWSWDVALYYARIDDEILSVEDPGAPGTSLVTNVERTLHTGAEASIRSTFAFGSAGHVLEPLMSLTINRFRFDGDRSYGDNDLPAAPEHVLRTELIYRHPNGFYIGPTVDRVGERWADFANTYRIDSHTLLGFRAGWMNGRWRAFADLRNLGDEAYVASHSVLTRAAADERILNPGEPFSAYFGFEVQW